MHRDLKVGLALGVLLVGIVGAFFFRRDPLRPQTGPALQTASKLDAKIAEKGRMPYLTDPELDELPAKGAGADLPQPRHQAQSGPGTASRDAPDFPEFLAEDDVDLHRREMSRTPPAPDAIHDDEPPVPRKEVARRNAGWETVPPQRAGNPVRTVTITGRRTHVIQPGETLTGLAERYLGSHARFRELYLANRELIADPNRLPVGTAIVIPDAKAARAAPIGDDKPAPAAKELDDPFAATEPSVSESPADDLRDDEEILPIKPSPAETPVPRAPPPIADRISSNTPAILPDEEEFPEPATPPVELGEKLRPLAPPGPSHEQRLTELEESEGIARSYQVRRGDSLERIASRVYGDPQRAREIYSANRHKLANPNAVREGMILVLP